MKTFQQFLAEKLIGGMYGVSSKGASSTKLMAVGGVKVVNPARPNKNFDGMRVTTLYGKPKRGNSQIVGKK